MHWHQPCHPHAYIFLVYHVHPRSYAWMWVIVRYMHAEPWLVVYVMVCV